MASILTGNRLSANAVRISTVAGKVERNKRTVSSTMGRTATTSCLGSCWRLKVKMRRTKSVARAAALSISAKLRKTGELLDSAAQPTADRGLFVTQVSFN